MGLKLAKFSQPTAVEFVIRLNLRSNELWLSVPEIKAGVH